MADPARVLRYKCTSASCRHEGEEHLDRLPDRGCERCGCKRLEIFDIGHRGHLVADWRSPKSLAKHGRRPVTRAAR